MHTDKSRLKVAEALSTKVIEFYRHCKHDEFEDKEIKCHHLEILADIAKQFLSDKKPQSLTSEYLEDGG